MKQKRVIQWMSEAFLMAFRSYDKRKKVGCYILRELEDGTEKVLGNGYNGTSPGESNICQIEGVTHEGVRHAEYNALMKVLRSNESTQGSILVCTDSPCKNCAKLIKDSGIKTVYYCDKYRDDEPIRYLLSSGITVVKVEKSQVIEHIDNFVSHWYKIIDDSL